MGLMGFKYCKIVKSKAAIAVRGANIKKPTVTRHRVSFHRPNTLKYARRPKYLRSIESNRSKLDKYCIIRYPLASETAIKKIEKYNTLTFIVDLKAEKRHIKNAMSKLYHIKVNKINTLIRPDGQKKAYIKLKHDTCALKLANKIGIV